MTRRVTRPQAEVVLREVRRRFAPWRLACGTEPKLVRRYDPYWGGGVIPYAILWEDGPSEWVYQLLWGASDPELLAEGMDTSSEPFKEPDLFLEAGTSFILCIFPEWS